jgi:hypothetical protein
MSHDRGWRAACGMTIRSLRFHSEIREIARGVTAMVVGSGALLGFSSRAPRLGAIDLDNRAAKEASVAGIFRVEHAFE